MQQESSFDIGAAVAAAKSTLTIPPPALGQPVLVVLCGLPGTGKTTLARRLADALPAVIIESDRVRQPIGQGLLQSRLALLGMQMTEVRIQTELDALTVLPSQ